MTDLQPIRFNLRREPSAVGIKVHLDQILIRLGDDEHLTYFTTCLVSFPSEQFRVRYTLGLRVGIGTI
jgi:hypothetical protein